MEFSEEISDFRSDSEMEIYDPQNIKNSHQEVKGYYAITDANGEEIIIEVNENDQIPDNIIQMAKRQFPNRNLSQYKHEHDNSHQEVNYTVTHENGENIIIEVNENNQIPDNIMQMVKKQFPNRNLSQYKHKHDNSHQEVKGYYTITDVNGEEIIIEVNENDQIPDSIIQMAKKQFPNREMLKYRPQSTETEQNPNESNQFKKHSNKKLHKNRPKSTETEQNPNESNQFKKHSNKNLHKNLPQSTEILTNPTESDLVEVLNHDESDPISEEEFNKLVLLVYQRYVDEARAKGYEISESTDENASSADEGIMHMEEDIVTKINECIDDFVEGNFNNEIDTMQCVDTYKDTLSEDEGIGQMEGDNAETNEAFHNILRSSEENYLYKKNEKEVYIISKKGVEDTVDAPKVDKVAVYPLSAEENAYITKKMEIIENEEDVCLITDLLPNIGFLVDKNKQIVQMDTGNFVEENYCQESLQVIIQEVKGKEKMYAILSTQDEGINRSRVLCREIKRGTMKLKKKIKIFLVEKNDGHEKVYKADLSKKQRSSESAHKANEAKIIKDKKSKEKNNLRILKNFFGSSEYKTLNRKRLPTLKEQFDVSNLVDHFIEEQISNLSYNYHRAAKFNYFDAKEYDPKDYKLPAEKTFTCSWHDGKCGNKGKHSSNVAYMKHFENRSETKRRECRKTVNYGPKPKKVPDEKLKLVIPQREKVGPLKKTKKLSELKQVLQDLEKKELLSELGISVDVFRKEKGLQSNVENMKKKNNNIKVVSKHKQLLNKRNSANSSSQNLSQMCKLKLTKIIEKLKKKLLPKKPIKRTKKSRNNETRQKQDALVKKRKDLLKLKECESRLKKITEEVQKEKKKLLQKKHTKKTKKRDDVKNGNDVKEKINDSENYKVIHNNEKGLKVKIVKKNGIGEQSEQPKTTVKGPRKRKSVEKEKQKKKARKTIVGEQQSEQPKTTVKGPGKRKAAEEAKQKKKARKTIVVVQQSQPEEEIFGQIGRLSERQFISQQKLKEEEKKKKGLHSIF